MNKNELKKYLDFRCLTSILKNSIYVGFFCIQSTSMQDTLILRKELRKSGYHYKVIKNVVLCKILNAHFKNLNSSLQGSVAICYAEFSVDNKVVADFTFDTLKVVFKTVSKTPGVFFLGSYFKGSFYSTLFEHKILSMASFDRIAMKNLSLIQANLISLLTNVSSPKNRLFTLTSKRREV